MREFVVYSGLEQRLRSRSKESLGRAAEKLGPAARAEVLAFYASAQPEHRAIIERAQQMFRFKVADAAQLVELAAFVRSVHGVASSDGRLFTADELKELVP